MVPDTVYAIYDSRLLDVFAFSYLSMHNMILDFAANRDHTAGSTCFGFGIRVENLREARYILVSHLGSL